MSLSYLTAEKVNKSIKDAILAETSAVRRDWWCESIIFFDDRKAEGKLSGDTKLMLLGYGTAKGKYVEVDPEDDAFMASRDASYIVEQLAKWSKVHGISWLVEETDMGLGGTIADGRVDAGVEQVLHAFATMFDDQPASGIKADRRAESILKKYADRNA